jgi:hypothetical protein
MNIGRISIPNAGGEIGHKIAQFTHWPYHDTIWTQILNWSQRCGSLIFRTAVRFQPGPKPTVLCPVRVTKAPRQGGSGFWLGLEPNQTKPPAILRTTGGLPGLVANTTCQALFRHPWNSFCFVVVTFSVQYTWTSIAAWIEWMICSRNRWDSLASSSSTWAFTDLDIFCSVNAPFFLLNRFIASFSAVRNRSEWFCWLTSREKSHHARTAPITISSEAVSVNLFPSALRLSTIGAYFTVSDLIMPRISLPCPGLHFTEWNGVEKCWRPRHRGIDVNR